jgi:molybdopterin molybdotransferase
VITEALASSDMLITTGGVSEGEADCLRLFYEQNKDAFQVLFNRVNVKPGKPVTCAVRHGTHEVVFSLPGNPVSGGLLDYFKYARAPSFGFLNQVFRSPVQ